MKRLSYILLFILIALTACKQDTATKPSLHHFAGRTMGTNYNISYMGEAKAIYKHKVDSILQTINESVSTYISHSSISILNQDSLALNFKNSDIDSVLQYRMQKDDHFVTNFRLSNEFFKATHGFFDPSIMPLVNYWGFGYKDKTPVLEIDSNKVKALTELCGLDKWDLELNKDSMTISKKQNAELDFSAVAKGYAVDIIADFLDRSGLKNYMVEIGGEVYCSGNNGKSEAWNIGLSKPEIASEINELQSIISLSDEAMASSGNYRNYYDVDGAIYGHEINPNTGYPEINDLLGVTVVASSCAKADALATAFMVMGLKRSKQWISNNPGVDAVLYFRNNKNEIVHYNTENLDTRLRDI